MQYVVLPVDIFPQPPPIIVCVDQRKCRPLFRFRVRKKPVRAMQCNAENERGTNSKKLCIRPKRLSSGTLTLRGEKGRTVFVPSKKVQRKKSKMPPVSLQEIKCREELKGENRDQLSGENAPIDKRG